METASQAFDAGAITVHLSVQIDDEFLLMPTTALSVISGPAVEYGLMETPDSDGCAVVLDALVEAHKLMLGSEFTPQTCDKYLQMKARHWLGKAFGKRAYYSGFAINGHYAYERKSAYTRRGYHGLSIDRAHIQDGDSLELFAFQDSLGMDYYTYFMKDGKRMTELVARAGEVINLSLEGLMYSYGGPLKHRDRVRHRLISPVMGAQMVTVDVCSGSMSPIQDAVTGEQDGEVAIMFDEPGEYCVSAIGGHVHHNVHVTYPWLNVIVG